jgi:hypothetical protein
VIIGRDQTGNPGATGQAQRLVIVWTADLERVVALVQEPWDADLMDLGVARHIVR